MDPWHYPRTEFARFIIGGMKQGLLQRVSIFAPRKRGKTQFIQYDVMPMCRDQGILPIYIDFWMDKNDPQSVFVKSVLSACEQEESLFKRLGKRLIPTKIGYNMSNQKVEVGFNKGNPPDVALFDVFQQLDKLDIPILLLLDEVQHLATKADFEPFTAALRSFVVNRSDSKVKCIFTGSSREGLNQLFRNSKAPFYNSSQTLDFSELDIEFVQHELATFKEMTDVELDEELALKVLIDQNRAPARFVEMLQNMVLFKEYNLDQGKARFDHDEAESKGGFKEICDRLKPIDLTILKLVAMNQASGIYTDKGLEKIKLFADDEALKITKDTVKNAINRLKEANYIYSPSRGKWTIENPEFRDFLLQID